MVSLSRKNNSINPNVTFTRKKFYRIVGILLAMLIAALISNYVAVLATRQIVDMVTRFIAAIFVAFLVGIGVGFVFKKIWDSIQKRYVDKA